MLQHIGRQAGGILGVAAIVGDHVEGPTIGRNGEVAVTVGRLKIGQWFAHKTAALFI